MSHDDLMAELEALYENDTSGWRWRVARAWVWLRNKPDRAWHGGIVGWQRRPLRKLFSSDRYWP